jgi:hypothetical protein
MPSDVVDAAVAPAVDRSVRELLVLWQHPETREIIPVGRLTHDERGFTYQYTRAAANVQGFRPLPGLGVVGDTTTSMTLPALFRLRVMDPDRADYATYLSTLGLSRETATPWEQIVHSGGERVGDTLQFMEVPVVANGRVEARFLANGVRHIPGRPLNLGGRHVVIDQEEHEAALRSLTPGSEVELVAQWENEFDEFATILTRAGTPLGWVPRALSASVRELMELVPVTAQVVRVNGPHTPAHLRLVLDLVADAPASFQFDREGAWEAVHSAEL